MARRSEPTHSEPTHSVAIVARPATGLEDLRAVGDLLSRAWVAGDPHVSWTPGDLQWWYAQMWPAALGSRLRLWSAAGRLVAWSWHDPHDEEGPREIEYHAFSGDRAVDLEVARHILAATVADGGSIEATAADNDTGRRRLLAEFGFERLEPGPDAPRHLTGSQYQRSAADPIADAALAPGYRIRSLSGAEEIPRRVEVHRAAFAPSRMSVDKYERLITLPSYKVEDDLVVEAPDGTFAAFTMAWWDPVARIGEFEPVGTHPDHQRRGLGKALLTHALRRYREAGARLVQVYSDAENVASEALYQSVGFTRVALDRRYRRSG
jgi:ribosomal protein S18 acetylase RimI-like enzyme